jgi:tetratricopeptide (TPR) repeat protein
MLYQRSRVLAESLPAEFPFTDNPIAGADFWIGRLTAMKVIARYLWLSVWPARLSCDYSYSEIPLARGTWSDWACWIAVLLAIVLVCFAYRWNRVPSFWAYFAAVTFFPMSNLAFPIGTIMAERFLYLPSIGLVACLVLAIYGVSRRFHVSRYAPAALCLLIACLAVRTWARNVDWQDEQSIIAAGLEVSPNSYKLHKQMALLLFRSERTPENIRRGTEEAERSVALLHSLPDVQNTAEPYCLTGEYHFLEGELQNGPSGGGALSSSGIAEYQKGISLVQRCAEIDKAVHAAYLKTLEASPSRAMPAPSGDSQPYLMLSVAYQRLNDVDKATDAVREALRLHPRSPAGYGQIANVFMLQKRREDAAIALTEGMLLTPDPGFANALATVYQEDPDAGNCKVIQTATGPAMNPQCSPIRQRVCALSAEVVRARLQAGREDLAEQQRLDLVHNYGCPAAALDPLFPQSRP